MTGVVDVGMIGKAYKLGPSAGGGILWNSPDCRVVRVADDHHPGFCQVSRVAHLCEMTDFPPARCLDVVRRLFRPYKINPASSGNMVPHLHGHIIPRWPGDRHFPEAIYGSVQREGMPDGPEMDNAKLGLALQQVLGAVNTDGILHEH